MEKEFIGKTFDDFLVRPTLGIVPSRSLVTLKTKLTDHFLRRESLSIQLPIISSNMDSITTASMAKTMALEGGIGFIHRGMSIDAQVAEVAKVKRSHGFIIHDPLVLPKGTTIGQAKSFIHEHNTTGILIIKSKGDYELAGILSNRDIPIENVYDFPVEAYMTPVEQLQLGSPTISMKEAEKILFKHRIEKLPLVDACLKVQGLITKKDIDLYRQHPHVSKDDNGQLLVGAAIGATGDYLERATELVKVGVDVVLIDIAHGHSDVMGFALKDFRRKFPDVNLIAGNVATANGARFLKQLGVDGIKVGIGPGRGCRTRLETGIGIPQLQAIREAWYAVGNTVPIIADGGLNHDKDIFLALLCGASTVMLGNLLSGTDESPGTLIEDPATGNKKKIYRGMTSPQAVFHAEGSLETPPEGQEIQVQYKGSVVDILHRIKGHLQSAISYVGKVSLEELQKTWSFNPGVYLIPLSEASRKESFER